MPTTAVNDLGAVGYIADIRPVKVPANGWSYLKNIRCDDKSIKSFLGHEETDTITPTPETMETVKTGSSTYLAYAGGTSIYSWRSGTETEIASGITRGPLWDSCVLGGVAIFTNGAANPYYWGGAGSADRLPFDTTVEPYCYWTDVDFSCRVIRSFKYHLFALNVTDCDGWNGRLLRWSHPAEPGSLPVTWSVTGYAADGVTVSDGGRAELSDTPGEIVDALILRDTLQVYKEDAIYQITYTGDRSNVAQQIFNIRLVTDTKAIYAKDCVVDIGGQHFVVGDKEIYLYDGSNFVDISDERVKNLFFDGVSRANYQNTFVTYYERLGEVWLCYPAEGSTYCNKVLVWNKKDNTWSEKEFASSTVSTAVYTIVDRSSGYTWETLPAGLTQWQNWSTFFDGEWDYWAQPVDGYPIAESLLLGGPQVLLEMDRTNQANGVDIECIARHTDLDLGDKADWHMVTEIRPIAEGDTFQVRVGYQYVTGGTVTWSDYQDFDPGADYKLDFRSSGRLHSIEFYSNDDVSWEVSGYEVDFIRVGRR